MNDILEVLQNRRTCRQFEDKPLPSEMLTKVFEAVRCSQSWANTQCWELVLIENPEIRKEIQASVPSQNPAFKAIVKASTLIAICAKTKQSGFFNGEPASVHGDWLMYDLGIATQNLCNEAHSLGLGTVVVAWFDHVKVKKIINLPSDYELLSLIPLGFPSHKGHSSKRKELREFIHKNSFEVPLS